MILANASHQPPPFVTLFLLTHFPLLLMLSFFRHPLQARPHPPRHLRHCLMHRSFAPVFYFFYKHLSCINRRRKKFHVLKQEVCAFIPCLSHFFVVEADVPQIPKKEEKKEVLESKDEGKHEPALSPQKCKKQSRRSPRGLRELTALLGHSGLPMSSLLLLRGHKETRSQTPY